MQIPPITITIHIHLSHRMAFSQPEIKIGEWDQSGVGPACVVQLGARAMHGFLLIFSNIYQSLFIFTNFF